MDLVLWIIAAVLWLLAGLNVPAPVRFEWLGFVAAALTMVV